MFNSGNSVEVCDATMFNAYCVAGNLTIAYITG